MSSSSNNNNNLLLLLLLLLLLFMIEVCSKQAYNIIIYFVGFSTLEYKEYIINNNDIIVAVVLLIIIVKTGPLSLTLDRFQSVPLLAYIIIIPK